MSFRNVNTVHGNFKATKKTSVFEETGFANDAKRECVIANMGDIPFNYVPPPANLALNSIPYKWPSGQEWSQSYLYNVGW